MFLAKTKSDTIEVLIPKSLIDTYISHDEFVSVNNVWREYNEMKEEMKNPKYGWCKQKDIWKKKGRNNNYNDGILWLNKKHIEEGLDYKNVREITIKYYSDHRKHNYDPLKNQSNMVFIDEELAIRVIMDWRTTSAHKFRDKIRIQTTGCYFNKTRISVDKKN